MTCQQICGTYGEFQVIFKWEGQIWNQNRSIVYIILGSQTQLQLSSQRPKKKTCLYSSKDSRPINLFPKKQRSRSSRHHDGINETALLRLRVTTFVTSYSRWKSKSPSTTKEDKALVDGQLRKMTKILPFYIKSGQGFEGFLPCNPGCSPNIIHVCLRPGSKH